MSKRVLIVEDERPLRVAAEDSLKKSKFEVVSVATADEARKVLDSGVRIDAVWLDHYLLGNETGIDVLASLRQNKQWQNIPVFAVTNSVGDDKVQIYQLLGIEKYFVKSNTSIREIVCSIKEAIV